jgi:F420-0:gamma-glutamyl ligase-like protein
MEKKIIVEINNTNWERHLIKTHFIGIEDNFESVVEKYVLPVAKDKDIIILCQKIVSIIQKRIVYKKDVKVSFWAKFLSKFVKKTPYGFSVGNPLKMQVAIDLAGLPRIFLAGFCSIICKLFGISGVFYRVAGKQISEIDGFYGEAYPQYSDMGILGPKDCDILCDKLKSKFGFSFAVADVNDLGGNILGVSKNLKGKEKLLLQILKDNPAGQSNEQTPIIIIREKNAN